MSSFQPPPDGFVDALRRSNARRRRRRLLEAAAGGTALAAVAALVLATNPGGLASLRQEQPAGQGQSAPSVSPTASGSTQTGQRASSGVPTSVASGGHHDASATPTPSIAQPGSGPGNVPISTPPTRQLTSYSGLSSPCADTSGREATGWCVQPGTTFTGRSGRANALSVSLCRLPGVLDGQASFPTTLEVGFTVQTPSPEDRPVWTLAAQYPGTSSRHTVPVPAGRCLTWSLTWYARDDAGHDVPPDQYTLTISIDADNISAPNQTLVENYAYTVTS